MPPLQFTVSQRFPVSLERLWEVCSRRAYVEAKYRALDSRSLRLLDFTARPRFIEVLLERKVALPLARLVSWLPRFTPASLVLRHHTRWWRTTPDAANVQIEIVTIGLPLHGEATGTLREVAADCTEMSLRWRLDCGGAWPAERILRLFAQQVRNGLRRDYTFTVGYLREAVAA